MKICIVGGVAGGASAATRLRRLDETADIVLFEKGSYISYANCGLPYYIGDTIKEKEKLIVTNPALLQKRFQIDVRTNEEVTRIYRAEKKIEIFSHVTKTSYTESYDKLLLSPGSFPRELFPEAKNIPGVFTLRDVADTLKIKDYVNRTKPKTALIAGGGFIGVEMAENLSSLGINTSIVEFSDHVVASFDHEMANILHHKLKEHGVTLYLKTGVASIEKRASSTNAPGVPVTLSSGQLLSADLVLLSTGVVPKSTLAKDAGLTLGIKDTIAVDGLLKTSDPDIYAVGDAISVNHFVSKDPSHIPLAGPANRQGRTAAANMLKQPEASALSENSHNANEALGSSVLKIFDLTAASTGLNEAQCMAAHIPYQKTYVYPFSHAGYYPGATQINLKLLFSPEGKILGAQAIGYEGVEKRMDVIATALHFHGSVSDLAALELCYAPPFSSAKDPVNMAGYTACNILDHSMPVCYAEEIKDLNMDHSILLDVSTPQEVLMGTIPGSLNIPVDELRAHLDQLDRAKKIYVFCRVGIRGYIATRILLQHGFCAHNLSGGYKTYALVTEQETFYPGAGSTPVSGSDSTHTFKEPPVTRSITLDACGLQCPGPIQKVSGAMKTLQEKDTLVIHATDPGFASDIAVWCERTGNTLCSTTSKNGIYTVTLQKGRTQKNEKSTSAIVPATSNDKTMVIFSGDLDKAIAAFIIANGALAMNRRVTLFFTFWGLNILRKDEAVRVKKDFFSTMFGKMMPRGSKKLSLSHMNMGGAGAKMIRQLMKKKNVSSLEELIASAIEGGVRVVACQMSMDLMGITKEELIDGVEIGGVATFLGSAETSDTNLFI